MPKKRSLVWYRTSRTLFKGLQALLLSFIGILCASLSLKGFLLPNGFIDGGITGISLLLHHLTHLSLPLLIVACNLPFIALGIYQVSWQFSLKTSSAIATLALMLWKVPFPIITSDKLLIAVFGGVLLGIGIGLCIRNGNVIDGTEVLTLYINKKLGLSIGDTMLMINILILGIAAFILGLEPAMYSVLTYLSASKTVDFILQGFEEYIGLTIISKKSDRIKNTIIHELKRGVTLYKGQSGYGTQGHSQDIDIVFTIITRLEVNKIKQAIEAIDPHAFLFEHSINDTKGGMFKRRRTLPHQPHSS